MSVSKTIQRTWLPMIAAVMVIAFCCCTGVAVASSITVVDYDDLTLEQKGMTEAPEYEVNENGLTYGPTFDPETGLHYEVQPDLQPALTTNGVSGWMYTKDFEQWSDNVGKDIDEYIITRPQAIKDAAYELFGVEVMDFESAKQLFIDHNSTLTGDESRRKAAEIVTANANNAIADGAISQESVEGLATGKLVLNDQVRLRFDSSVVEKILDLASENTATHLTVYELDGATPIGEVLVYDL